MRFDLLLVRISAYLKYRGKLKTYLLESNKQIKFH